MYWLNLGSLIFGLIAWGSPIASLAKKNKVENKNWAALSMLSLTACIISLYMQIIYNNYLVRIEDWSALMDTTFGVVLVSGILLVVTVILNIKTLVVYRKLNNKIN
jgi:cytochrome c oxidase subunit 4